jgi:hypothetical protein
MRMQCWREYAKHGNKLQQYLGDQTFADTEIKPKFSSCRSAVELWLKLHRLGTGMSGDLGGATTEKAAQQKSRRQRNTNVGTFLPVVSIRIALS